MKKVTFLIPDRAEDLPLSLFAGVELVGTRWKNQPLRVKLRGCNLCGKCCDNLLRVHMFPLTEDKSCMYLKRETPLKATCSLRGNRPLGCCIADPAHLPYCSIVWEEIDEDKL